MKQKINSSIMYSSKGNRPTDYAAD